MPDNISQATSIDQPVEEEVQVEALTPEEGSEPGQPQKEETFTRADVERMLADFGKQVESRIQSQVAKSENRTNQRIQERLGALEMNRAALGLTDEQYEAAQDAIIKEEQKNAFKPQTPEGNGSQRTESAPDAGVMFSDAVQSIYAETGVTLSETDPQWKKYVEPEWNNPKGNPMKTLAAIQRAAEEKAEAQAALKKGAKARTTGGGGSNTTEQKPRTAEEKISQGLKKTEWRSETPQK